MATCTPFNRIIIHGNKECTSSQLKFQKSIENNPINSEPLKFFPFTELDELIGKTLFHPNLEMKSLLEQTKENIVEVSAILILVSLNGIFSKRMFELIVQIPHQEFYKFDKTNETEWWDHVIMVFISEEDECRDQDVKETKDTKREQKKLIGDSKVKETIRGNTGVKELVRKSGDRYIHITNKTPPEELEKKLRSKLELMKDKLVVGQLPHSKGFREVNKSFVKACKKPNSAVEQSIKEVNQSLILVGESSSGKSTLGNLLMGPRELPLFATEWYYGKPSSMSKKIPMGNIDLLVGTSNFGIGLNGRGEDIKVQIVDLPQELIPKHCEIFAEVLRAEKVSFLILFNIHSGPLSDREFVKIKEIIQISKSAGCNVFQNAIIVFTHVESLEELNEEVAEKYLRSKIRSEKSAFTTEMLSLVKDRRYVYINSLNLTEKNRGEVLEDIFKRIKFPRPKIEKTREDQRTLGDVGLNTNRTELKSLNNTPKN